MYGLLKNGTVFTSTFVGTGPSSYEKRIYRAAVSQRLRNTGLDRANFVKLALVTVVLCFRARMNVCPIFPSLLSDLGEIRHKRSFYT